jgi:hypothetical protein
VQRRVDLFSGGTERHADWCGNGRLEAMAAEETCNVATIPGLAPELVKVAFAKGGSSVTVAD